MITNTGAKYYKGLHGKTEKKQVKVHKATQKY